MFPSASIDNSADQGLSKTQSGCDVPWLCAPRSPRAYFKNIFGGKLRAIMRFPSDVVFINHLCFSSLLDFILLVVFMRPNKQMLRPDTRWIVAFMKHTQAGGNFPKMNLPRGAVASVIGFVVPDLTVRPDTAPFLAVCGPHPAISKVGDVLRNWSIFINLLPKTLLKGFNSLCYCIHKQKPHPHQQKCCRQAVGRNRWQGWESFVSCLLLGYNKARGMLTQQIQSVNPI